MSTPTIAQPAPAAAAPASAGPAAAPSSSSSSPRGGAPGPRIRDLPDLPARGKSRLGDAPVIPIGMILIGGYLAWFGVHYWRDQTTRWPSDPLKAVLQGKGLPAPDPAGSVLDSIETSVAGSQDSNSEGGTGADEENLTTPGSGTDTQNQNLGKLMAGGMGWTGTEFTDLVQLWNRESGWSANARNSSSGAYGIAQALGHGGTDTAGTDGTNEYGAQYGLSVATARAANSGSAVAQIAWGLRYIKAQYGSPSAAWAHEEQFGWY